MCRFRFNRNLPGFIWLLALAGTTSWAQNFPPTARITVTNNEVFTADFVVFVGTNSVDPDNGPQPLSYEWDFSDGVTSTESNPSHAFIAPGAYRVSLTVSDGADSDVASATVFVLARPTATKAAKSSPIAFSTDERRLWMVNPDSDSITLFDITGTNPTKIAEMPVGKLPRTVAVSLDDRNVFVACQEANQVWVFDAENRTLNRKIAVGHEPYAVVVSPVTGRVLVSNQGDDSVTVIGPQLNVESVVNANDAPRAIAITADGQRAFVSHFVTRGPKGEVTRIDLSAGLSTQRIALDENPGPDTPSSSAGVPNLLSALTIDPAGRHAWVGGLKANSRRGAFLSGRALTPENTVRGFFGPLAIEPANELLDRRIDSNNADSISAIAFSPSGRYAYVTHQGAEMLSVYDIPAASMIIPGDGTPVPFESRIDVGSAPQGILVSSNGQRAYVANFLSRDLMALDLSNATNPVVIARVVSTTEPLSSSVANGKRLFYRSRAPKHSRDNYISCTSCHADGGMDDGQIWDFTQRGEGLRNTIDLRGRGGMRHGPVHWSANFDEIQDFENDIVNEFGGTGLAQDGQPPNPSLGAQNAGRSQDLDDLAAYVASLRKVPKSPYRKIDGTLTEAALNGKRLFNNSALQCTQCHTPPEFTDSILTNAADYVFHNVGTLTAASGRRLGAPLPGLDTPGLFGLWSTAPYLHDGSASNLLEVLIVKNTNDQHGVTSQLTPIQRAELVAYLLSIDGTPEDEPVDYDGDQISDAWELLHSLNPDSSADATADPDNDGLTSYQEFIAGTDPTEFFSRLHIREISRTAGVTLAMPTVKGISYTLQYNDRISGLWTNGTSFFGDGAEFRHSEPPTSSPRFYRISVTEP
jgi:DNA-binding beta-propeller fold protein YncE